LAYLARRRRCATAGIGPDGRSPGRTLACPPAGDLGQPVRPDVAGSSKRLEGALEWAWHRLDHPIPGVPRARTFLLLAQRTALSQRIKRQ
jgi:hypothetical protein